MTEERWDYMHALLKHLEKHYPEQYEQVQIAWGEGDFSTAVEIDAIIAHIENHYPKELSTIKQGA